MLWNEASTNNLYLKVQIKGIIFWTIKYICTCLIWSGKLSLLACNPASVATIISGTDGWYLHYSGYNFNISNLHKIAVYKSDLWPVFHNMCMVSFLVTQVVGTFAMLVGIHNTSICFAITLTVLSSITIFCLLTILSM